MPTRQPSIVARKIEQVQDENQEQLQFATELAETSEQKEANTRHQVAMWCVIGYFSGLLLILIGTPLYNYAAFARAADGRLLLDLKDTLLAYQAVVGTLIGAVVAYYFKTKLESGETDDDGLY